MKNFNKILLLALASVANACTTHQPMPVVESVDLERFMGDWYVIANIPTFLEKDAYNPVESYRLEDDGTIATTFTFNKGSLEGELKQYHPRGFVTDTQTNAVWGMQFIWPIKADYRIVYLDDDYEETIIGRNARDYVWIMSRKASISDEKYQFLVEEVGRLGYDLDGLRKAVHGPVKQARFQTFTEIEYSAISLGMFHRVVINKNGYKRYLGDKLQSTGAFAFAERNQLNDMVKDIAPASMATIEVPSTRHQFDGAMLTTLTISNAVQSYSSPSFDHDNPPEALQALVEFMQNLP